MKSRFDGIVKVKKQQLDLAQTALTRARNRANELSKQINFALEEILKVKMPTNGTFAEVSQTKQILDMARRQKKALEDELSQAKIKISNCQKAYEEANKELEKMVYLKDNEIAEKLKAIKKKEQLEMDEIALQLFAGRME